MYSTHEKLLDSPFLRKNPYLIKDKDHISVQKKIKEKKNNKKSKETYGSINEFNFSDSFFSEKQVLDSGENDTGIDEEPIQVDPGWVESIKSPFSNMTSKFLVCHLNVNSIFCKVQEINKILNLNLYDLVLITESKLGSRTQDIFLGNPFYNMIRRDIMV